jgi:surface antigen
MSKYIHTSATPALDEPQERRRMHRAATRRRMAGAAAGSLALVAVGMTALTALTAHASTAGNGQAGSAPAAAGHSVTGEAGAAASYGPYLTMASPSLNERTAPSLSAGVVGSLPYHATIYIDCQTGGSLVGQSTVWDQLTSGVYISDYWTNTSGDDIWTPGIARCSPPKASTGRTLSYDEGADGECTWWAISQFHAHAGRYPDLTDPADNGNAEYWASNAVYNGWTVVSTPEVDSIAVFPPGVNGAESDGHVAWVTSVSGAEITISEMNGPAGWDQVDTRMLIPASSVRYILAP